MGCFHAAHLVGLCSPISSLERDKIARQVNGLPTAKMGKRPLSIVTFLVIVIGIGIPITLSIYLTRKEALSVERERALSYASEVVVRSEAISDQVLVGLKELVAARYGDPCSMKSRSLMKQIDLSSSYIQAVGYVAGNRMICSSLGEEMTNVELGPVDTVRPSGAKIRLNVEFPFAKGKKFLVVELDGYVAVLHKGLPFDEAIDVKGISLIAVTYPGLQVLAAKGVIKPKWLKALGGNNMTFVDEDNIVAVVASKRYFIGAICALPISELNRRIYKTAMILIPMGVLGSLLFLWSALYLAKLRTAMPTVIKAALKRKEFVLEYQPIVDLSTGEWVGAEVLVRWHTMEGHVIKPDIFIPIAEESGLIQQVSQYVVNQLSSEAAELFRRFPDFHIGINLAAADLHDEATVPMLKKIAAATGARPKSIMVEATERSFTDHNLAGGVINRLRAEGFLVAIDDFGTGYSSLAYLERIKLDYLKIDKSFVDALNANAATSEVILHIIEMAKGLKLEMIAEGVETETQAQFLRERGVQYGQGWLYSKPMPLSDLLIALENSADGSDEDAAHLVST